ncbi:MAG TPA: RlpA-like double-psi beta-barrel domain-containing protein [Acetobacteraceae bacterium]|nr:RlpA-like double-psi beta-barrel domain-containing protein [Acetobacteraceae bacterium]
MRTAALLVGLGVALSGCVPPGTRNMASGPLHYVIGRPYQAGGVWRYPRERFDGEETGLATIDTRTGGITADGEAVDPTAMAAAHPTLQLPSVVRVTNLDNGYQALVRVNDRGPADPGRVIALSPRAMALLRPADPHAAHVRVDVMPSESLQLAADLGGAESPRLALVMVPLGDVVAQPLPVPPGATQAPRLRQAAAKPVPQGMVPDVAPVPLRLPETVTRVAPHPGNLYVEVASFGHAEYAALLQGRLASIGAQVVLDYNAPRDASYRVRVGPLPGAAAADATLARVIAAGQGDARIVVQ